jgi:hypothetical protein
LSRTPIDARGWIDTTKAVARYGLDYATLQADLAAGTAAA